MTKNRTSTPVYLDPGMHSGLEVKGLSGAESAVYLVPTLIIQNRSREGLAPECMISTTHYLPILFSFFISATEGGATRCCFNAGSTLETLGQY